MTIGWAQRQILLLNFIALWVQEIIYYLIAEALIWPSIYKKLRN